MDDSSSSSSSSATTSNTTSLKEPVVSQRVTRSSQRYAQQNGDNLNELKNNNIGNNNNGISENDGDDNNSSTSQSEKVVASDQSGRKAKRKKLEQQAETEQDGQQQTQQLYIPEFCPSDYKLPESNSIQLYRDLVKKRHKEMMQLANVPPKAPCGIKDYLLLNGPYLLEGDKLGLGLSGAPVRRSSINHINITQQLPRLKIKFSRTRTGAFKLLSSPQHQLEANRRLNTYKVPKLIQAPESLRTISPLHELFQIQEKARHKMRLQHLKERERSILASEQEILRAYNREYILSACSYFHHQEKYHYVIEREGKSENLDYPPHGTREVSQQQEPQQPSLGSKSQMNDNDTNSMLSDTPQAETAIEQSVISKLINDLQELDDKWSVIKQEMYIRHKNESDTLYAIQVLEWDWRAKETGSSDKEFVPRVEVSALEY